MEDEYDEYRRWDGDVDVEVCSITISLPFISSVHFMLHKLYIQILIILFFW